MRQCPTCAAGLEEKTFPGKLTNAAGARIDVTIDECGSCGGMWFDEAEIEQTMGAKTPLRALMNTTGTPTQRGCVRCSVPMSEVAVLGVQVDVCGTCHGLWLDGGELKSLYEQYAANHDVEKGMSCSGCGTAGFTEAQLNYGPRGLLCDVCFSDVELKEQAASRAADAAMSGQGLSAMMENGLGGHTTVSKNADGSTTTSTFSIQVGGIELGGLIGLVKGLFESKPR